MAISQHDRRKLYASLEATLGPDAATTLMELLPGVPADELVTIPYFQTEMALSRAELRAAMAEQQAVLRDEMAELKTEVRGDMAELKTELRGDMADLKVELKSDVLRVENDLTMRMANLQTSFTRWSMALGTANVVALVTALAT